jgi:hypothetical protein
VFDPETTFAERRAQHGLMVQQHQQLMLQCQALEAALRDCVRAREEGGGDAGGPPPPLPLAHLAPHQSAAALAALQQQAGGGAAAAAAAALPAFELPAQVVQFAEAHRIIVIDAVRTDFRHAAVAPIYSSAAAAAGGGGPGAAAAAAAAAAAGEGADAPRAGASGGSLFGPAAPAVDPMVASWVSGWVGARAGGAWGPPPRLWVSEAAQQVLDNSGHLSPEGRRQAARLIALLSAYAVYDPATGYCQG